MNRPPAARPDPFHSAPLRRLGGLAVAALLALTGSLHAQDADALTPETLASIRAHVLPSAEEQEWKQLGWRATLWDGVIDAQAARKPIVLWAMNGHPLGCT